MTVSGQISDVVEMEESKSADIHLSEMQLTLLNQLALNLAGAKGRPFATNDIEEADKPRVIEISPKGNGLYSVKVHNAIGAIGLPGLTLAVKPKIPIEHFSYLAALAYAAENRSSDEKFGIAAGSHFLEMVANWLIDEANLILRAGLPRDYNEKRAIVPVMTGTVHAVESYRHWFSGRAVVECTFEEFEDDNSVNRLLKAALGVLKSAPNVGDLVRVRALKCFRNFTDVGDLRPGDIENALATRGKSLKFATRLAADIMSHQGRELSDGLAAAKTFLLPTPSLIEEGIRRLLERELKPVKITKGTKVLTANVTASPDIEAARPPFTADVKYKVYQEKYWTRNDLAQAVFFAASYRSPIAAVVHFATDTAMDLPVVPAGDIDVTSVPWSINSRMSPRDSAASVVEKFKQWIPAGERLWVASGG